MSFAFEILSAALNEAIADVAKKQLPRRVVEGKIKPSRPKILRPFKHENLSPTEIYRLRAFF